MMASAPAPDPEPTSPNRPSSPHPAANHSPWEHTEADPMINPRTSAKKRRSAGASDSRRANGSSAGADRHDDARIPTKRPRVSAATAQGDPDVEEERDTGTHNFDAVREYTNEFDATAIEFDQAGGRIPSQLFDHFIESAQFRLLDEEPSTGNVSNNEIPMRRLQLFSIYLNDNPFDHVLLDAEELVRATSGGRSRRGNQEQHIVHGSGFVGALYVDEDGQECMSQDGDHLFDEPVYLTLTIKDLMVQYVGGDPVVWVQSNFAWYRLDTPRSDYADLYHQWLIPHYLSAHIALAIESDLTESIDRNQCATMDTVLDNFTLPTSISGADSLENHSDVLDMIKLLAFDDDAGYLDAIRSNLMDFHDPDAFSYSHPLVQELGIEPPKNPAGRSAHSRGQRNASHAAGKKDAFPTNAHQRPVIVTPLVGAIQRACNLLGNKVVVHGDKRAFKYPPTPTPPTPRDRICVGDVVVDKARPGVRWVVREISSTARKPMAHLLKLVPGNATLMGGFADQSQLFAVPECIVTQARHLVLDTNVAGDGVDRLFTGTAYVALQNVRGCPACHADTIVFPPEDIGLDDLPEDGDNPLIQKHVLDAGLYESMPSSSVAQVWIHGRWVFLYDFVYFAVGPDGQAVVHDCKRRQLESATVDAKGDGAQWSPESSLYAIAQVIGMVERKEHGSDEEKDLADPERVQIFRSAANVDFQVEFLGRWDSLNHSSVQPAARHPRRLFLTEKRATIPAAAVVGTLCIVPLSHVKDGYFEFPHNFVTVGEHKMHDPLAVLHVAGTRQLPANPADDPSTDPLNLQAFTEFEISNYSVSVLIHLNHQLKSFAFKDGKAVLSPLTAFVHEPSSDSGATHAQQAQPITFTPLRALDLFAGCGGLSVGLDTDALGVCETKWAVEGKATSAQTFKTNLPSTQVLVADASELLKRAIDDHCGRGGEKPSTKGKGGSSSKLPKVGAIDMIYSGLPGPDAKSGQVAVALSYVELYRPKALLLAFGGLQEAELVGDDATALMFVARVLVTLGYQVGWMIAQAGSFGCPQNRRRLMVLATLPHIKLPSWPEETHLFPVQPASIPARGASRDSSAAWSATRWFCTTPFALFPPSTVSDITSDLPPFDWQSPNAIMKLPPGKLAKLRTPVPTDSGPVPQIKAVHPESRTIAACGPKKPLYATEPYSELQRLLRRIDPSSKQQKDQQMRSRIYDWGGIETHFTAPSEHIHRYRAAAAFGQPVLNHVNRTYSADVVERVCNVSRDKAPYDHRTLPKALVPFKPGQSKLWHNGAYGRLDANGQLDAVPADPHPSRKHGTILHPIQNRVLTVREMARAQSFPDWFEFTGDVIDMYQQVASAVPPFLAVAVNRALFDTLLESPLHGLGEEEARQRLGLPPLCAADEEQ